MTFEEVSREEVDFVIRSAISFVRGMVCSVILMGEEQSIDELDGLLTRPDLPSQIMEYLHK